MVARKPLSGTVAATVQQWGTGALNIDACRLGALTPTEVARSGQSTTGDGWGMRPISWKDEEKPHPGRWPANVILDEDMAGVLDEQSGTLTSGKMKPTHTTAGVDGRASAYGKDAAGGFTTMETYGDSGGASRFFKVAELDHRDEDPLEECPDCLDEIASFDRQDALGIEHLDARFRYHAKAPKRERPVVDGVAHPTVKPLALMRWLVRLVTPPGGVVLEPFAGSGTTVEACIVEGFRCVAIEREADYLPLILERIHRQGRARIEAEVDRKTDPARAIAEQVAGQLDIFGEATAKTTRRPVLT